MASQDGTASFGVVDEKVISIPLDAILAGAISITAVTSPEGTTSTYEYLPTGEIKLAKTVEPNGRRLSEQQYDYDENGNLIKENLIYPKFKLEKTYEYDAENQLIKATEKESKTTRVTQYFYDNVGNRIATRLDVNGKYKGIQEWQNNADNQLLEITSDKGATYEYDANGHVSQKRSSLGEVTIYQYDVEGRLIQESSTWGKQTYYTYDALGNRISKGTANEYDRKLKTDMMSWMKATDREAQLRLEESDITLSDILTKLTKNPAFISYCLPIKDRTWRIDHDTNRRKVTEEKLKKAVDTTVMIDTIEYLNDYTQTYVSPLQDQYTTYDKKVKSSYQATNIYDNKGMAIGNDLDTYHQDGLKSNITQISKENGRLYSSNLYQGFGSSERRINDQAGYRSQYHDNSADIHLRAREYNTTTGRFLQQDTVLGDLETPVTQNKYVYANNNPFMYRDDAGRKGFFSNLVDGAKKLYNKYVPAPIRNAVDKYIVQPIVKVATGRVNIGFPQPNPLLNNPFVNNNSLYGQFPQSVILNGKTYNLNDPIIRSIYNQAVESRKKAEASKQKQCSSLEKFIDQVVKGSYSKYSTWYGTAGEIVVGFIPVLGQIADARDLVHGIQNKNSAEIVTAGVAFIPGIGDIGKGAIKGSKEVGQQVAKEGAQSAAKETAQQASKNLDTVQEISGSIGINLNLANKGSTGRSVANSLNEQLAMKEVVSNLEKGKTILTDKMNDPRWLYTDGWVKKAQNVNGTEIHYLYNTKTGQYDDFKFKE
ncbi:hypothetical protein FACS1894192_07410 [Bacilli bacterium]|nr:hypothetical protein FACS1894192_07410 [Bacilli bacterium]